MSQLAVSDMQAAEGVGAAIIYLTEHGRAAVGPYVEWTLARSAFGSCSGEIRWPNPEYQLEHVDTAWRGLFVTNPECDWFLFTVLGNKARYPAGSRAWYDHAVQESDNIASGASNVLTIPGLPKL